ncbi:MAG: Peptidase, S41 family [uncultured Aureispira sp.]|uniref:Peptidase, S41 family n=1 Tax=uncultured Aureispira sp. TaxID=1331704 RepID=A0A6S6UB18_9BACT|nr:MAG: Peptidase, S41 family [uncultured Aureispira sp.]
MLMLVMSGVTLVVAQPDLDIETLSPLQLQEDLDHLVAGLERYNPTMYVYNSEVLFKREIAVLKKSIHKPMNAVQWFKLLCLAVEKVEEGHVTIGTREDAFYRGFLKGTFKSLPLSVQFLGERAYVWNNLSRVDALERGDEILSINGRSMAEIRTLIFQYTNSDGDIETFKQMRLSKELSARYFWFIEQTSQFTIEYRKRHSEGTKEVQLEALTRIEMSEWAVKRALKKEVPKGMKAVYDLDFEKDIATLTLRSFNEKIIKQNELEPYTFYERMFKRLRQNKTKHLILDVRGNIGGMKEFVDDLLAFTLKKKQKGVLRELIAWDGTKVISNFPKRNKWFFKGDIYILTNGGTYSTAALIAQYLSDYGSATVIGEETGSRYEGFAAGNFHYLTLPNSKIQIGIPNKWVKNTLPRPFRTPSRGLMPDYRVRNSIDDLLQKKDPVKAKALELIQDKKQS